MRFSFTASVPNEPDTAIDSFMQHCSKHGLMTSKSAYRVRFESKGIFNYWNFALYQFIDYGSLSVSKGSSSSLTLTYSVTSLRFWLAVLLIIFFGFAMQYAWYAVTALCAGVLLLIYVQQFVWFRGFLRKL